MYALHCCFLPFLLCFTGVNITRLHGHVTLFMNDASHPTSATHYSRWTQSLSFTLFVQVILVIPAGSMTRRLTVGSCSEMGLLSEHTDPETPPPLWTPPKTDFWKRPSRWQVCLPRLRFVAKIAMSILFGLLLLSIYFDKRPTAVDKAQTEEERVEASKRETWLWKDFPRSVIRLVIER